MMSAELHQLLLVVLPTFVGVVVGELSFRVAKRRATRRLRADVRAELARTILVETRSGILAAHQAAEMLARLNHAYDQGADVQGMLDAASSVLLREAPAPQQWRH